MSLGLVSPLLNRGVRSRWLASLPGAGSKMLTIDSNGDTSFQDIPVAAWGSITGTLSAQTDLQSALDGKLSLTGGTLTGAVTANSTADLATSPKLFSFQHNGIERGYIRHILDSNTGLPVTQISVRSIVLNGNEGLYNPGGIGGGGASRIHFEANGERLVFQGQSFMHWLSISGDGGTVQFGGSIGFTSHGAASGAADLFVRRDAANTLAQRNSTNAQTFRLYGTYTDASNYRRLYLSSTTAGAFTIGVEGAGTGASGNTLTVPNAMSVNGTLTMTNTGGTGLGNIQITGGSWWLYAGGTIQAPIFNVNGFYGMSDLNTGGLSFGSGHGISWGSSSLNVPARGSITGDLFLYRNAAGQLDIRGDSGLRVRNVANTADAPITAGAGTFSDSSNSTLTVTSSSTNVTTFGVNNSSSTIGWAFQIGGSSPLTGAPAGSFTFRQTTNDINAGIIASDGRWLIGSGNPIASTQLAVVSRAASNIVGLFRGAASQTGNLTEWQNSSGSILSRVGIEGAFYGTVYNGTTYSMSAHYSGGFAMGPSAAISFGNSTWPTTGIQSSITFDSPNFSTVGAVALRNGTNTQFFRIYNTYTDASNYIRQSLSFTTYSSTVHAQHVVEGAGTGAVNVPFVITPRGTGAFILGPMPDGTATGGNARGQNAVDLQVVKTAASQVASGRYSFTVGYANTASGEGSGAGGYNTSATGFGAFSWGNECTTSGQYGITLGQGLTASGYCSTAFGRANSATAQHTLALGYYTSAWVQGMIAFGSGTRYTNATVGDQQAAILPMLGWSAGPTAIELLANAVDRLTVPTRCAFGFTVEIFGVKNKAGQAAFFHRQGIIKNIAGTTSLTGTIQTVGTDINPASASVSITANNTNDSLKIECTQPTGEFTGATGDSTTDIITLVGHPFVNGDEVCFSSLTGGSGLAIDTKYFVRDVSGNTFKLTTSFVGNTAINFTTDITAGTMDYIWYWHCIVKLSRINFGLY